MHEHNHPRMHRRLRPARRCRRSLHLQAATLQAFSTTQPGRNPSHQAEKKKPKQANSAHSRYSQYRSPAVAALLESSANSNVIATSAPPTNAGPAMHSLAAILRNADWLKFEVQSLRR
jgi:hypothetical protein